MWTGLVKISIAYSRGDLKTGQTAQIEHTVHLPFNSHWCVRRLEGTLHSALSVL